MFGAIYLGLTIVFPKISTPGNGCCQISGKTVSLIVEAP
jgi:hypothetical protein